MERPYETDTDKEVSFFTGIEIEKTPAYGLKTLFVVGVQPIEEIAELAKGHGVDNVYLGANQSYTDSHSEEWNRMIEDCIKELKCYITIDIDQQFLVNDPDYMDWVCGWCENNNVIPMISVKLPYIGLFNYNTTVKIDDNGFDSTNPGVWCHSLHDLKSKEAFTPWIKYTKDTVIK